MLAPTQQPLFEIDPLRDPRWQGLVDRHPSASIFHTPGWLQALAKTYGYRPLVFTFSPPDMPLTSGILFCEVDSWLTGRRLVSLPFSDHCEPLVESDQELHSFLDGLQKRTRHWKYVEIRPRPERLSCFEKNSGFGPAGRYFLHTLDLRPSLEELYNNCHRDSVRRKIRRAERERLEYEEGRSDSQIDEFYRLLLLTRRRHQLPPQPLEWFRNLRDCMGDKATIRIARKDGQAIASILTLQHKKALVYKYGCSDGRFHNLGGILYLFWNVIQEAKQNGLSMFDLGRSDCDNSGLVTFKDHWGATRSTLTYLRYPAQRPHAVGKSYGTQFAKRLFAYAPEWLLTLAGKALYKHIG